MKYRNRLPYLIGIYARYARVAHSSEQSVNSVASGDLRGAYTKYELHFLSVSPFHRKRSPFP